MYDVSSRVKLIIMRSTTMLPNNRLKSEFSFKKRKERDNVCVCEYVCVTNVKVTQEEENVSV